MLIAFRVGIVVISALSILFAISSLATNIDRHHYISVVRDAVENGSLGKTTFLLMAPHVALHEYNFNDCLILSMLVLPPRGSTFQRAVSPLIPISDSVFRAKPPSGYPPYQQCEDLFISLNDPTLPSGYYHRYLHGGWVLAAALLAFLSFHVATNLLSLILWSSLATIMLISVRSAWRRLRPTSARYRDLAYLSIAIVLTLFYALPVFGRSLSFAPSDIVLISFVLFSYLSPLSRLSEPKFVTAIAVFGSLTAIFEFFIGAIPSGAAVLLTMLALDPSSNRKLLKRRACLGLICFLSAISLSFACKAIAVFAIWGSSEVGSAGARLGFYLGHSGWEIAADNAAQLEAFGISPDTIKSSRILSTAFALSKIVYFSPLVGLGSRLLGIVVVVILPLALAARCCWFLWRVDDRIERVREVLVLSAAAMVPLWYAVFPTHTIIHASFMVRPTVWILAIFVAREIWRLGLHPVAQTPS